MVEKMKKALKYIAFIGSIILIVNGTLIIREGRFLFGFLLLFIGVIYPNQIAIKHIFGKK